MDIAKNGQKEAERRGLPNVKTTPLALDAFVTDKAKNLFESIIFIPIENWKQGMKLNWRNILRKYR